MKAEELEIGQWYYHQFACGVIKSRLVAHDGIEAVFLVDGNLHSVDPERIVSKVPTLLEKCGISHWHCGDWLVIAGLSLLIWAVVNGGTK